MYRVNIKKTKGKERFFQCACETWIMLPLYKERIIHGCERCKTRWRKLDDKTMERID